MATQTPIQQLPVPEDADDPDVPGDMMALALAVEKKLVQNFANAPDRDAYNPNPIEGSFAVLRDPNQIHVFFDGSWRQVYPPAVPPISHGSAVPQSNQGVEGEVYFQI